MAKYLLIFVAVLLAAKSPAQRSVFTFGPKFGYTFGAEGGLTLGFEASYFPSVKDPVTDPFRYGFTFDASLWKQHASVHLGAQIIGCAVVGLEVGPTLVWKSGKSSIYLGSIVFAGAIFYPYFETVHRPDADDLHSIGTYFKLPTGAWVGGDGWWTVKL